MLPRKLSHSPGKEGRPREFANFPKLPSSRLVLGAGREAEEAAVPAAGRMRLDGGGPGGFALSEFEAVSKEEREKGLSSLVGEFFPGASQGTGRLRDSGELV